MIIAAPPFPRPLEQVAADPGVVADVATELLAASARLDDAGELARTSARLVAWQGAAAEAYRADLGPCGRRLDALSLALRAIGRRVEDHAHTLRSLLAQLVDLTDDHRCLVDEVLRFGDEVPGLAARGRRALDLTTRVHALDARQVVWGLRWRVEEEDMVVAFARLLEVEQAEDRFSGAAGAAVDPADVALLRKPGPDAGVAQVLAWWRSLSTAQRRAVVVAAPGAVGDLDGIPAGVRDQANRLRLSRDLATLRHLARLSELTGTERGTLRNAQAVEDALARHAHDSDPVGRPVPVLLWIYDPGAFAHADGTVDGRVAIALGDPDTADAVALNVPGIRTEADDIGVCTDRGWQLHQAATTADPDQAYSSIAWLGYDAPPAISGLEDLRDAAGAAAATRGGALLADSVDGLRAVGRPGAAIVPIGHSYGSVTLGAALTGHHVSVDRAVAVGSPGLGEGIDRAGDLDVPRGQLYVGQNHDDPVADLGQNGLVGLGGIGHGQDPADDGFGAVRFQANAGPGHDDHTAYYDTDSESLHNLGRILAGLHPTPAAPVHDPWWGPALDPEDGAPSDRFDTDGDGDVDGFPRRAVADPSVITDGSPSQPR